MKMSKKTYYILISILILILCIIIGKNISFKSKKAKQKIIKISNNLILKDINGHLIDWDDYKDRHIYIKAINTNCKHCIDGMKTMEKLTLMDKYKPYGVVVWSLLVPSKHGEKSLTEIKEWYKNQPYNKQVLVFDTEDQLTKISNYDSYPTGYFINNLELVDKKEGNLSINFIKDVFDKHDK